MTAPDSRDSVLLPCPSCGGAAELRREHGRDVSLTWIECSACPIRTTSRGWLGSDEAIVDALAYAWNNRPALARGPQQAGGEDWQLIDGKRSADGLAYSAVYWCANTGALKTETTSDGRFRAGDGPRIRRPTGYAALQAEVARLRQSRDAYAHDAAALLEINKGTAAALEAAEAALREAQANDRRYRWLNQQESLVVYSHDSTRRVRLITGERMDVWIDAAIAEAGK